MLRTDYFGHDRIYRKRRAAGNPGWETAPVTADTLEALAQELNAPYLPHTGRVLEIGCGAGDLSLFLAMRGFEVWGVDVSPFAVGWAREKAKTANLPVRFTVGDVRDLAGFSDAEFDLVLDGQCLHCIIGDDRTRTLQSVRRVLKPGGVFHIRTMCGDPTSDALRDGYDPQTRCIVLGGVAVRYLGAPENILNEVRAASFEVIARQVVLTSDQTMLIADAHCLQMGEST